MSARHPRREFLLRALALAASPGLLAAACGDNGKDDGPPIDPAEVPRGYFANRDFASAMTLGEAYMTSLGKSTMSEDVRAACARTLMIIDQAADDLAAIAALEQSARADFLSEGDLVDLQGWMLARTELELCALLLL